MSHTVSVHWLRNRMQFDETLAIIDTRYDLNDPSLGRSLYEESHIPGAIYFDLKEHLSGKVEKHGGSHPLPSIESFAKTLGENGIDNITTVIVYDEGNNMYASRAWWMLHYMGHKAVYVLDGGLNEWVNKGYDVTDEIPKRKPKKFSPEPLNVVVNIDKLKQKLQNKSAILIDSRSRERYLGEEEPLYHKAGHIPGAKNFFWQEVFNDVGLWKSPKQLEKHFSSLKKTDEIIVSCGSGVSACPNIVALKMAGYENVKLYPGSFSDWISYDDNPLVTGDEE
ncbi:MAG TPA: sulfurtransferase [Bacillota bacterium]|nr:sulfurtransferase [Bacillota bacterium]